MASSHKLPPRVSFLFCRRCRRAKAGDETKEEEPVAAEPEGEDEDDEDVDGTFSPSGSLSLLNPVF